MTAPPAGLQRIGRLAKAVWTDPVGSNAVAALALAAVSSAYAAAAERLPAWLSPKWSLPISASLVALLFLGWYLFRPRYKTLVFLSLGGTCRDPMAKIILEQLLKERAGTPKLQIVAAGLSQVGNTEASLGARYAIQEMFGQGLLDNHVPVHLSSELVAQADLILAMDTKLIASMAKTFPGARVVLLKEFFGLQGNIDDPWRANQNDPTTLENYRACATELRKILEDNIDHLLKVLSA